MLFRWFLVCGGGGGARKAAAQSSLNDVGAVCVGKVVVVIVDVDSVAVVVIRGCPACRAGGDL